MSVVCKKLSPAQGSSRTGAAFGDGADGCAERTTVAKSAGNASLTTMASVTIVRSNRHFCDGRDEVESRVAGSTMMDGWVFRHRHATLPILD